MTTATRTSATPLSRNFRARIRRCFLPLLLGCLLPAGAQATGAVAGAEPYVVEILKASQTLRVKRGQQIERTYHVALGSGGMQDKQHRGDKLTPTGVYRIVDFNEESDFYLFMQLNYPNVKDAFWGYRNKVITEQEFDHIIDALKRGESPPQNTALGGGIGIHGLGPYNDKTLHIHQNLNWTEGCIALTNDEVAELRSFVGIGTRVEILE